MLTLNPIVAMLLLLAILCLLRLSIAAIFVSRCNEKLYRNDKPPDPKEIRHETEKL